MDGGEGGWVRNNAPNTAAPHFRRFCALVESIGLITEYRRPAGGAHMGSDGTPPHPLNTSCTGAQTNTHTTQSHTHEIQTHDGTNDHWLWDVSGPYNHFMCTTVKHAEKFDHNIPNCSSRIYAPVTKRNRPFDYLFQCNNG